MSWLADPTQRTLSAALDGLALRQSLIASNLANIDTPGYQPKSVDFETALQASLDETARQGASNGSTPPSIGPSADTGLRRTDPRHLGLGGAIGGAGATVSAFAGSIRNDGNAVDLESEMTALAEGQIRFAAVSRLTTGRLGMLRDAITGGR
jgi:flagellar basal-body rod protein FlgB